MRESLLVLLCTLFSLTVFAQTVTSITQTGTEVTEGGADEVVLTATLDVAAAQDVSIPLTLSDFKEDFEFSYTDYLKVSTLTGGSSSSTVNGDLATARFSEPQDVLVAEDGTIYVSENYTIRKIATDGTVSTLAGAGCCQLTDGTGSSAVFYYRARGMAFDLDGNIIVADENNHAIRKVTPAGVVTTIAGTGSSGFQDGPSSSALFSTPSDVAVDSQGNIYVADNGNYRIRKIGTDGNVTTVAGNGTYDFQDGNQDVSGISEVYSLVVDANDNLLFADRGFRRIRRINSAGETVTLYGDGNGFGGTSKSIGSPQEILLAANGEIYYFDDNGYQIRKISPNGTITTLIGDGIYGKVDDIGTAAQIGGVNGMAFDNSGKLLFTHNTDNNYLLRQAQIAPQIIIPAGETSASITFSAVNDEVVKEPNKTVNVTVGTVTGATYTGSDSFSFDVVDNDAIDPTVEVTLSADELTEGSSAEITFKAKQDFISGVDTQLAITITGAASETTDYTLTSDDFASGTLTIPAGDSTATITITEINDANVEVIEELVFSVTGVTNAVGGTGTYTVSIIDDDEPTVTSLVATGSAVTEGDGSTYELSATIDNPASFDVEIFFDISQNLSQIEFSFDNQYALTSYSGQGINGQVDGPKDSVLYSSPYSILGDENGNIYVGEGNRIRKINPSGNVSSFAGINSYGFANGVGTNARFNYPDDLVFDSNGNMLVADRENHRIRKITPAATVSTIAGGASFGNIDGAGANARFHNPSSLAVDSQDNIFVWDNDNRVIRKIDPANNVSTFAGSGESGNQDGIGLAASFGNNVRLAMLNDVLYFADQGNSRIGTISLDGAVNSISDIEVNNQLSALAISKFGHLFFYTFDNKIYRYDLTSGDLLAIAGSGDNFFQEGIGESASFSTAYDLGFNNNGDLFFGQVQNQNRRILKLQVGPKIIIPAGQTSGTLSFTAKDDTQALEPSKSVSIAYSSIENASLGITPATSYDFTIEDDDTTPPNVTLSLVADTTYQAVADLTEGSADSIIVYARQDVFSALDTEITLTIGGTATASIDYADPGTTITIAAGDTTGYVVIKSIDDSAVEVPETIEISVASITNGTDVSEAVIINLNDNDQPTVTGVAFDNTSITEGDANGINLTATLDAASSFDVSIPVSWTDFETEFDFVYDGYLEVETFAGGSTFSTIDGTLETAKFDNPHDILVSEDGIIYVSEKYYIRKIDPEGNVTTLAGLGCCGLVDGTGSDAGFYLASGMAFDIEGNIIVADEENDVIRKVTPEGVVTTIAGTGIDGFQDGVASEALFNNPRDVAVDSQGNIYVADYLNLRIRKIDIAGNVTTVAGNGNLEYVDGSSDTSSIGSVSGIIIDEDDNLLFGDLSFERIRMVSPQGITSTLYGDGTPFDSTSSESLGVGKAVAFAFSSKGVLYYFDRDGYQIRKINEDGTSSAIIGSGNSGKKEGIGTLAQISGVSGMAFGKAGNLLFTHNSISNFLIRQAKVSPQINITSGETSGSISFIPVDDEVLFEADQVVSATLGDVVNSELATGVATSYDFTILDDDVTRVSAVVLAGSTITEGTDETVTLTANLDVVSNQDISIPVSFSGFEEEFTFDYAGRLQVSTLAGGSNSNRLDGTLATASFNSPNDVLVADDGTIYVSESYYIRKIAVDGTVSTLAGAGCCQLTDGTGSDAYFYGANAMDFDLEGNIIVADLNNHAIRRVTPIGVVTTIAGTGSAGFQDGPAESALFNGPMDVDVDSQGNIYVADNSNYRIRKIDTEGNVTTVAGNGQYNFIEGSIATSAIGPVQSLFIDEEDNVIFGDRDYNRIRVVSPEGITRTLYGNGNSFGESGGIGRPWEIVGGENRSIYIYDGDSQVIRQIMDDGTVIELIGDGQSGFANGLGTEARIGDVRGMTFDNAGNLLFTHNTDNNYLIRKVQLAPQINIPAGELSGAISFTAVDDSVRQEPDEVVSVTMGAVQNADYAEGVLTGGYDFRIVDNDAAPPNISLSLSRNTLNEDDLDSVLVVATLDTRSGLDVTMQFAIGGEAERDADYTLSDTTLTIPAGETSSSVSVKALQDNEVEIIETITLLVDSIGNAVGDFLVLDSLDNVIANNSELIIELIDEDEPNLVSIEQIGTEVIEGGIDTVKLVATIDTPTSREVVVNLDLGDQNLGDFDFDYLQKGEVSPYAGSTRTANVASVNGSLTGSQFRGLKAIKAVGDIIYIIDDQVIKKIEGDRVEDLAGQYAFDFSDGTGFEAIFYNPSDLDIGPDGFIYVADEGNNRIRKISPEGVTTTVAGNGEGTSEDGQMSDAKFNQPYSLALSSQGDVFVFERNGSAPKIRKISGGTVSTILVASTDPASTNFLSSSSRLEIYNDILFVADPAYGSIARLSDSGILEVIYKGSVSSDITFDSSGSIYWYNSNSRQIQKFSSGVVESIIGNGTSGYPSGIGKDAFIFSSGRLTLNGEYLYFAQESSSFNMIAKANIAPKLIIPSGQTNGAIKFYAVNDNESNEEIEPVTITTGDITGAIDETTSSTFTFDIIDDEFGFVEQTNNPIIGLEDAAISWGDYDRDGDKDLAILGNNPNGGATTQIYQNDGTGVFSRASNITLTPTRSGDLDWVDLNNDGYIDLVTTGQTGPSERSTVVYINNQDGTFTARTNHGIEPMLSAKMVWADFDNNGSTDLVISGLTVDNQSKSLLYYNQRNSGFFTKANDFDFPGQIRGDVLAGDLDQDGDNDLIVQGEDANGNIFRSERFNTYVNELSNGNFFNSVSGLSNSVLRQVKSDSSVLIFSSGENSNEDIVTYITEYKETQDFDYSTNPPTPTQSISSSDISSRLPYDTIVNYSNYKNGDIALADANNDGRFDFLITGLDALGNAQTDIWLSFNGQYTLLDTDIPGVSNSKCEWVDVDNDGDLDAFVLGINPDGRAETYIYLNQLIQNRANQAPDQPTNLELVDLGNGNVQFQWTPSADDYSTNIGYNLRIGTTPGGAQILNPSSDFVSGDVLIQGAPQTTSNSYVTNLPPGNYYWTVQAIDDGYQSSGFATEESFSLAYEWRRLNQGGLVDRSFSGTDEAVLEFFDIDGDRDMDILYGDKRNQQVKLYINDDNIYREVYSNIFQVVGSAVGDLNGDGYNDVVIVYNSGNEYQNQILFSKPSIRSVRLDTVSNILDYYTSYTDQDGLASAVVRIADLDNDGRNDLVIAGKTSEFDDGTPKLYMSGFKNIPGSTGVERSYFSDLSAQFDELNDATYDFGDLDNDRDVDFMISGLGFDGLRALLYRNVTDNATVERADFTRVTGYFQGSRNGTTNFIDYDGDGDLDVMQTGASASGNIFDIFENRLDEGIEVFASVGIQLDEIIDSKIDLGDFNGDGYADLLYSGLIQNVGKTTRLAEYNPVSKTYEDSDFDVSNIIDAEVEFGDLDGDGDLDFMITGADANASNQYVFDVYLNVRNESARLVNNTGGTARALRSTGIDQSMKTQSLANTTAFFVNEKPTPPSAVNVPEIIDLGGGNYEVSFSWAPGSDDFTPQPGLTYALRIGSRPGEEDIMSSGANEEGVREKPGKGNVEHNTSWRLKLTDGVYQWAVQAIDASYNGSVFTPGGTIVVGTPENLAPEIVDATYTIAENSPPMTVIDTLEAVDPEGGALSFAITSGNQNDAFVLDSTSGELKVQSQSALDYEQISQFNLSVTVTDSVDATGSATITINLQDVDESSNTAPVMSDQSFEVSEIASGGTVVGAITASDVDNDELSFSIVSGNTDNAFALSPAGQLTVNSSEAIDFDGIQAYSLQVEVNDGFGGIASATVTVNVINNEEPIFENQTYSIEENSPNGSIVGILVASDPDGGIVTFEILEGNLDGAFEIRAADGAILVANSNALDFETNPLFNLTISVTDDEGGRTSAIVQIALNNVDEGGENLPPVIADQSFDVFEDASVGTIIGTVQATDPEGDVLNFSITETNRGGAISIDELTGELSVSDVATFPVQVTPEFQLIVQVADGNGGIATAQVLIANNEAPLGLGEASIVIFPVPVSNSFQILAKDEYENVIVTDIAGRMVKHFQKQNAYDISDLSAGIYHLRIEGLSESITIRLIVK